MGICCSDSYYLGPWEPKEKLPREKKVEDFVVVWLDPSHSQDSDKAPEIEQLQQYINLVVTCSHPAQCEEFISGLTDEKVFLIVSGPVIKEIASTALKNSQIDSIYSLCTEKEARKINLRHVGEGLHHFSSIKSLCNRLGEDLRRCTRNLDKPLIVETNQEKFLFMYDQILQELIIDSNKEDLYDLLKFLNTAYVSNVPELKILQEFEGTYSKDKAIFWYTKQSGVYKTVNNSLRTREYDNLYELHVYIRHLHEQIVHKSKEKSCEKHLLFRGQAMSIDDFNHVKTAKGKPMFFRNFLSTSSEFEVAMKFAQNSVQLNEEDQKVRVFFKIKIDGNASFPYASIGNLSMYEDEAEYLFSMGSTFRIDNIETIVKDIPMENKRGMIRRKIHQIELTLMNDDDKQLMEFKEHLKNFVKHDDIRLSFARVMYQMANWEKSKYFYKETLKKEETTYSEQADIYNNLGSIALNQQRYDEALQYYEKSIEFEDNEGDINRSNIALTYQNIATVHYKKGNMDLAVETLRKAITIHNNSPNRDLAAIATIYNNMAYVLNKQRKHNEALKNNKRCLYIRKRIFPSIHPSLAIAHNSLAITYNYLRWCSEAAEDDIVAQELAQKAVNSAGDALNIDKQALPKNHPQMKIHKKNLKYFLGEKTSSTEQT